MDQEYQETEEEPIEEETEVVPQSQHPFGNLAAQIKGAPPKIISRKESNIINEVARKDSILSGMT
jgi:hypothetical protein